MNRSLKTRYFSSVSAFFFISFTLIFLHPDGVSAQSSVRAAVRAAIGPTNATFGIAWKHMESGDTGSVNGRRRFPMQSVYKFPLALSIIGQIDRRRLSFEDTVSITPADYSPDTWSPIMRKYPNGADLTLRELLAFTVTQSDNVGCDVLFRLAGGPAVVEKEVHALGVRNIAIRTTEKQMHADWEVQFQNWCEPLDMMELLDLFYKGKPFSKATHAELLRMMEETTTGPKRIKGLLPEGTVVAHRTGSSGKNADGISAASNDVGIVTLPDRSHLIIVVFITQSPESYEALEAAIARVARAIYDGCAKNKSRPGLCQTRS